MAFISLELFTNFTLLKCWHYTTEPCLHARNRENRIGERQLKFQMSTLLGGNTLLHRGSPFNAKHAVAMQDQAMNTLMLYGKQK